MKNSIQPWIFALLLMSSLLGGCTIVAEIFKAGVWFGVLMVVAVIGLLFYFIMKVGKK